MEGSAPAKPKYMIDADAFVVALERDYSTARGIVPLKGLIEAHKGVLNNPQAVLHLKDSERKDLTVWYRGIYKHLSAMTKSEASVHPLRAYKKQIYQLAQKLYTKKEAAKQFLTCADYYTDEEKELDEFCVQPPKQGYQREPYIKAKRSLAIQKNREKDIQELQKNNESLDKKSKDVDEQIAKLAHQLKQLQEVKALQLNQQKQIDDECKSLNSVIYCTTSIYNAQMAALVEIRKQNTAAVEASEEAVRNLKRNATGLPHNLTAEKEAMTTQTALLTQLKADQAAIQRDIHLLTGEYDVWNKILWKFSGFLTSYPVDDLQATPGNEVEKSPHEEIKDTASKE